MNADTFDLTPTERAVLCALKVQAQVCPMSHANLCDILRRIYGVPYNANAFGGLVRRNLVTCDVSGTSTYYGLTADGRIVANSL